MKFKAPDRIGSVSLSRGTYTVVNGLVDIAEVSDADVDALKAFGFERFTAVEEGTFRRRAAERGPEGEGGAARVDDGSEPGPVQAVTADVAKDAPVATTVATTAASQVAPSFKQKWEATDHAREVFGIEFDGRRSLKWMNEEIARLTAASKASGG